MNHKLEFILNSYLESKEDLEDSAELFMRSIGDETSDDNLLLEAVEVLFSGEKYRPLLFRNPQNGYNIAYCLTTIGAISKYISVHDNTDIFFNNPNIPGIAWVHAHIFVEIMVPRMYEDWFKEHKFFKVNNSSSEVFNLIYISDKNELLSLYYELPDSHKDIYYYLLNRSNIVQNYIKYDVLDSIYIHNAVKIMKKLSKSEILYILKGNNFTNIDMFRKLFWIIKELINAGINIEPMDIEYPEVQLMIISHILNM